MPMAGRVTPAAKIDVSAISVGRRNDAARSAIQFTIQFAIHAPASPPATASGGNTNTKWRMPLYIAGRATTVVAIGRRAASATARAIARSRRELLGRNAAAI